MIKNTTILITGGSSGLGLELINLLLEQGNKIYHLGRPITKKKNLKSIVCDLKDLKKIKKKIKKTNKYKANNRHIFWGCFKAKIWLVFLL